eukprot:777028-Prorocentrum_minimum.AAC.3
MSMLRGVVDGSPLYEQRRRARAHTEARHLPGTRHLSSRGNITCPTSRWHEPRGRACAPICAIRVFISKLKVSGGLLQGGAVGPETLDAEGLDVLMPGSRGIPEGVYRGSRGV